MIMNKAIVALAALLLFAGAVSAQAPTVKVDVLKFDPAPAEPGKFLEIWLSIDNVGTGIANDVTIRLEPAFPFFLDTNEDPVRNFAFIDADGARAKYRLRVAEDAPNGDSILKVRHTRAGVTAEVIEELPISVLGKVDVDITSVEPSTLLPGQPATVSFTIDNTGRAPVRDLIVTWNDRNNKLLPLGGENRARIVELGVGQSTSLEFSMIADPGITQGVHVIEVNMTFQRFGIADSRTSNIAFIVGGLTDFDVAQQELVDGTLSLSVANIGVNTATGVLMAVPEQPGWTIIGGSSVFLGNLDAGDFTVASLQLQALGGEAVQTLRVDVAYTDTTGIRQTVGKELSINLAAAEQPERARERPDILLYVVIAVIILGGLWIGAKRLRKRKR